MEKNTRSRARSSGNFAPGGLMEYSIPKFVENVKFKPIMLGPERACQLLGRNHPRNRKMKPNKIRQMAADIQDGNWQMTPEPIILSDKDHLIDGQNRCQAVIEAGIAIPVWLCSGQPEETIVAVDCGSSRNVADASRILGKDIKGITGMAATARRMAFGCRQDKHALSGLSIQETLDWIDKYSSALAFAWECLPLNKVGITRSEVRAVLARAYYRRPVDETRKRCLEFGKVLFSGLPNHPKEDSSAIRLRNWLQEHLTRGQRKSAKGARPLTIYAKTEAALDNFLRYETTDKLHESSQELFFLPGEKDNFPEMAIAETTKIS